MKNAVSVVNIVSFVNVIAVVSAVSFVSIVAVVNVVSSVDIVSFANEKGAFLNLSALGADIQAIL